MVAVCKVKRAVDEADSKADGAAIELLLASNLSVEKVMMLLREHGFDLAYQSLRRHKLGLCCCRLSA